MPPESSDVVTVSVSHAQEVAADRAGVGAAESDVHLQGVYTRR